MKRALLLALLLPLATTSLACKTQRAPESVLAAAPPATKAAAPVQQAMQDMRANFQRVHFDFDSASLTAESKNLLAANARLMADHAEIAVEIQGHCDERGTTDYNMALGQRRAQAVSAYLKGQGVAPSRLKTVSYGEERPLSGGSGETVWSQNRRAEFRVYAGESVAVGTVQ